MRASFGSRPRRRWPVVLGTLLVACLVAGGAFFFAKKGDGAFVDQSSQATSDESSGSDASQKSQSASDTQSGEQASYDLSNPDATTFAAMVQDGDVSSIRLIGDSITEGYLTNGYEYVADGSSGAPLVYDIAGEKYYEPTTDADDWANAFRLWATSHGVSSFVNAGVGGKKMADLASNVDGWAMDGADVIFVSLGTNDATYGTAEAYAQAAEQALPELQKRCKLLVVMSPITDLRTENHTYAIATPISQMSAALRQVCLEHGIVYLDMQDSVSAGNFNYDGLHPTTAGSLQIWESVKTQLGLAG